MKRLTTLGFAWALGALSTLSFAAPGAHGPDGEHLDQPPAAAISQLARLPDGSVNVPKQAQRRMAIRTRIAPQTEAARTVELPGRVVIDPNAGGRIQPLYGGRIEAGPKGLPIVGQTVKKGDTLAWVRHQTDPFALANQRAQGAELRTALTLAEQRVVRLEGLEGSVPRKDIDAARAELAGLREREAGVAASLGAREALISPVSGVVARADVVSGQVVGARETLFEIIDPRRLLIEATVPDSALASRIGSATLKHPPGVHLELLGASGSLRDGVLPVMFRSRAGSTAPPLAVGQPVSVIAQLTDRLSGIVLPAQAITRNTANEPVVWIKSGAERFIAQPVRFQALDAETIVVTSGLAADNRVVVQGAPLIAQIR
ncbi:MAG: HlyD family efflux transporter periplasmic adaptor subunit [Methyloversatilis sp.]|uniref:efflux RND transporter periplasmic adaptor subunit n=1 Tax=Methyloversatilis sp. TaxID=2569862 RepID=UPI002736A5BB|nr:HlyD family efflux transporter periplasmic adaptor subunit [Methyloversatilis sp.]MDP3873385.1 HlyD family efflux transporter periplasmic adaptor subunit [Methyloversatilis sp.]